MNLLLDYNYYINQLIKSKKYKKFFSMFDIKLFSLNIIYSEDYIKKFSSIEYSIFNLFYNDTILKKDVYLFYEEYDNEISYFKMGNLLDKNKTKIYYPVKEEKNNIFDFNSYDLQLINNIFENKKYGIKNEINNYNETIDYDDLTILLYNYYEQNIDNNDYTLKFRNDNRKILYQFIYLIFILQKISNIDKRGGLHD